MPPLPVHRSQRVARYISVAGHLGQGEASLLIFRERVDDVVDEVQNLRSARAQNAELVLNLFSEIIERLGISLLALATPAVQAVVEGAVRNTRKLASFGSLVIEPMARNSPQWEEFCDTYWDYTFV